MGDERKPEVSKLGGLKDRLRKSRTYSVMIIVFLALVVTCVWGVSQYKGKNDYRRYLSNQFNRSFYTVDDYINNITSLVDKAPLVTTSKQKKSHIF